MNIQIEDVVCTICFQICHKTSHEQWSNYRKRLYCSKKCYATYRSLKVNLVCKCGKQFLVKRCDYKKAHQNYCSLECSNKYCHLKGDEHSQFRTGKYIGRSTKEGKIWCAAVKDRDNHTCQRCGLTEKLVVHHIKEWDKYPKLRYDVENGQTLCRGCHLGVHNQYRARAAAVGLN